MKINIGIMVPLVFVLLLTTSCSEPDGAPQEAPGETDARTLASTAARLERDGDHPGALEIYQKIAQKYPDTKIFLELKIELERQGISIEAPLTSEASIGMFKVQNLAISYFEKHGYYPTVSAIKAPTDPWGNNYSIRVNEDPNAKWLFAVICSGKDGRLDTKDDLFLGYWRDLDENSISDKRERERTGRGGRGTGTGSIYLSDFEEIPNSGRGKAAREKGVSPGEPEKTKPVKDSRKNISTGDRERKLSLDDLK